MPKNISIIFILIFMLGCELKDKSANFDNGTDANKVAIEEMTELQLIDRIIDAGTVHNDTTLVSKFYFKNTGESDLIIKSVLADCTCTGYRLSQDTLAEGEKGYLELMMDTEGKYGEVSVNATIEANTDDKFYNVKIKVNIVN